MQSRVRRIFEKTKTRETPVDAIVLMNAVDPHLDMSFFYATDLMKGGLFERSAAILKPDGSVHVLTSPLEEGLARLAPEAEITIYNSQDEKAAWYKEHLGGAARVGINGAEVVHSSLEDLRTHAGGAELVDIARAILDARLVKDARELARMQRACDIASVVASEIPGMLTEGMKEYELAAEINYRMQKLGASGPSFSAIVAFGEPSAEPHYATGERKLAKGDYVLTDFGCYFERYASDITRTCVFGAGSDKHRDVYETVLRAQEAALRAIKPGVKGGDVHTAAADVIADSPYKGRFIHSIGHSLGIAVHDGGALHPRHDLILEEGMVVTIEPGIYIPGFGGVRIEDDVVVTADGYRSLTNARKNYEEVNK